MAESVRRRASPFSMFTLLFQDSVDTVINKAIKELAIEKAVHDIESTWDSMSFAVHKYCRQRGAVVEEQQKDVQNGYVFDIVPGGRERDKEEEDTPQGIN